MYSAMVLLESYGVSSMGHISQEQASAPRSAGQTSRQRRRNGLTASFPPAAGGWMSDLWFRIGNYGSAGIYSAKPLPRERGTKGVRVGDPRLG